MRILAIETSCDETALTILSTDDSGTEPVFTVEAHLVHSQTEHAAYGGVYPNVAKREHAAKLLPLFQQVLQNARLEIPATTQNHAFISYLERQPELAEALASYLDTIEKPALDYICVTTGPGLPPALWVGVNFARTLAASLDIPLIPVNHMEGHILSVVANTDIFTVPKPSFPTLALLVSGGHTELVLVHDWGNYEKIGTTLDDAAGEAFDKVARLIDLPYPGGPKISKLAATATREHDLQLPRPMLHSGDYNFSFSGLKTAVRRLVEETKDDEKTDVWKADLAREFESAVTEVLVAKTAAAISEFGAKNLIMAGGVAANPRLRNAMQQLADEHSIPLQIPDLGLTGDNSLMIGIAGYFKLQRLLASGQGLPELERITANGNWSIADA